jgi:hypothetical protein
VLAHEFCFAPEHWERVTGIRIIDDDGWRSQGDTAWNQPLTRKEFIHRAIQSTAQYPRGFPKLLDGPL